MIEDGHNPVLSNEVLKALNLPHNGLLIDATFGRGGHSNMCLQSLGEDARVLGIDRDVEAVEFASRAFAEESRITVKHSSFSHLKQLWSSHFNEQPIDGILIDLGVSSPQLDQAERGFSFMKAGPLDMRMDTTTGDTALQWLIQVSEDDLSRTLRQFGEERFSRRIAAAIKLALETEALLTTADLARIVAENVPVKERNKHPATRSFQAIRIAINQELKEVSEVLPQAIDCLRDGGRLVVISFHSLEDRIVKRFIRDQSRGDNFPPDLPVLASQLKPRLKSIGKAIRANGEELSTNPRARSAVLRVAEKLC